VNRMVRKIVSAHRNTPRESTIVWNGREWVKAQKKPTVMKKKKGKHQPRSAAGTSKDAMAPGRWLSGGAFESDRRRH
jgi:hypothetical protein